MSSTTMPPTTPGHVHPSTGTTRSSSQPFQTPPPISRPGFPTASKTIAASSTPLTSKPVSTPLRSTDFLNLVHSKDSLSAVAHSNQSPSNAKVIQQCISELSEMIEMRKTTLRELSSAKKAAHTIGMGQLHKHSPGRSSILADYLNGKGEENKSPQVPHHGSIPSSSIPGKTTAEHDSPSTNLNCALDVDTVEKDVDIPSATLHFGITDYQNVHINTEVSRIELPDAPTEGHSGSVGGSGGGSHEAPVKVEPVQSIPVSIDTPLKAMDTSFISTSSPDPLNSSFNLSLTDISYLHDEDQKKIDKLEGQLKRQMLKNNLLTEQLRTLQQKMEEMFRSRDVQLREAQDGKKSLELKTHELQEELLALQKEKQMLDRHLVESKMRIKTVEEEAAANHRLLTLQEEALVKPPASDVCTDLDERELEPCQERVVLSGEEYQNIFDRFHTEKIELLAKEEKEKEKLRETIAALEEEKKDLQASWKDAEVSYFETEKTDKEALEAQQTKYEKVIEALKETLKHQEKLVAESQEVAGRKLKSAEEELQKKFSELQSTHEKLQKSKEQLEKEIETQKQAKKEMEHVFNRKIEQVQADAIKSQDEVRKASHSEIVVKDEEIKTLKAKLALVEAESAKTETALVEAKKTVALSETKPKVTVVQIPLPSSKHLKHIVPAKPEKVRRSGFLMMIAALQMVVWVLVLACGIMFLQLSAIDGAADREDFPQVARITS